MRLEEVQLPSLNNPFETTKCMYRSVLHVMTVFLTPNFAAVSSHEDAYANASEPPAKKAKTDE